MQQSESITRFEHAAASERQSYTYEPLKTDEDCIRLISLQPALEDETPLHVTFVHNKCLDDFTLHYEAISYHWGAAIFCHSLCVGDQYKLLITSNLNDALLRVRKPTRSRLLWVDALCINQGDDGEKSRQIPMMASIFHNASRVLACVGGGEIQEKGMNLLAEWSRGLGSSLELLLRRRGADAVGRLRDQNVLNPANLLTVYIFLSLPWFSRLWIIQEVVFNTDVVLLCGDSQISWVRLIAAVEALLESPSAYGSSFAASNHELINRKELASLREIAKLWKWHCMTDITGEDQYQRAIGKMGVLELVDTFGHYGCADPRDTIFALYNMAYDILPLNLADHARTKRAQKEREFIYMDIDYSTDILTAYRTFAIACICSKSKVDLLNAILARQYEPRSEIWPSWVPDWRLSSTSFHHKLSRTTTDIDNDGSRYHFQWGMLALDLKVNGPRRGFPIELPVIVSKYSTNSTFDETIQTIMSLYRQNGSIVLPDVITSILSPCTADEVSSFMVWIKVMNTNPSNVIVPESISEILTRIQKSLGNQCFFIARAQSYHTVDISPSTYIGYGNNALEVGDELAVLNLEQSSNPVKGNIAFVLRPVQQYRSPVEVQPYRMIGSAYLSLSITVRPIGNVISISHNGSPRRHTLHLV